MRKAYIRIKLPEEIVDWVAYIVTNRLLGYRSMIEFVSSATRKEVQRLREGGFIPPVVPKVRSVAPGAIGVLSVVLAVGMLALLFMASPSVTGFGVMGDVFGPLEGWDFASIYARFGAFINFTLYFVVFFAVLFTAAKKWFDKREAGLVAGVFAVALAFALSIVPINWFKQLSPIGLLLLAFLLFALIFEALKLFGFTWLSSGSLAFILAYLLLRTHRPDLFVAAGSFGSMLNIAFFIAFLVALFKAGSELLKKSERPLLEAGHAARLAWAETFNTPEQKELRAQEQASLSQLLKIQPEEFKKVTQIQQDLDNVEKAVRKYGYSRQALASIAEELGNLRRQDTELGQRIARVQELAAQLEAVDIDLFGNLKKAFEKLPLTEKRTMRKAIEEQAEELKVDATLTQLAQSAQDVRGQIDVAISDAQGLLMRNLPHDALKTIERARYHLLQLREVLRKTEDCETRIQAFLNRSLRSFQK